MDKGLILVIIGGLLSCTIYGVIIGAPLTLIGAYFVYKSLKDKDSTPEEIEQKKKELEQLDEKLAQKEAEKNSPNKKIIQSNLKNASQVLDEYITDTLKKPSKVVEGWIDSLFLQNVDYNYDESIINPDS